MKRLVGAWLLAGLLAAPALAERPGPAAEAPMARGKSAAMFGNVSPEGRRILGEAMRSVTREDRMALRAARDRISDQVAAEPLDIAALGRAMEAERRLVGSLHAKRQAALLAALPRLSAADRLAFAEDARRGRDNVEARTAAWRRRMDAYRQQAGEASPK